MKGMISGRDDALAHQERGVHAAETWTTNGALDSSDGLVARGRFCGLKAALLGAGAAAPPCSRRLRERFSLPAKLGFLPARIPPNFRPQKS